MRKIFRYSTLTLSLLLFAQGVYAKQEITLKDGDSVKVTLSASDATRIIIDRGRIEKIVAPKGMLDIQADKERGEVFLKPLANAPESMSFFVRDDSGATFTLVATRRPIPGDTIVLKNASPRKAPGKGAHYLSTPFVERVKQLIKAMALGENVESYAMEDQNRQVEVWQETNITLVKSFTAHDLYGEVYLVANASDEELRFHEREFMEFGDRVQAVALERLVLKPQASTFLYIVRRTADAAGEVR
jgi:type-F conjugative transfer system secretin TraK